MHAQLYTVHTVDTVQCTQSEEWNICKWRSSHFSTSCIQLTCALSLISQEIDVDGGDYDDDDDGDDDDDDDDDDDGGDY